MTTEAATEVLDDQVEVEEKESQEAEQVEGKEPEAEQTEGEHGAEAEDEIVVSIGEESPPSDEDENRAPEWVRELRKSNREKDRKIRELEQQVQAAAKPDQVAVGEEPTLEDCDYDADKFKQEWKAWNQRKQAQEEQERKNREAAEAETKAWQAKLDSFNKAKAEMKVKDYDDAQAFVEESLNVTQQGVILHGAENPALLVYALGRNPKKAKELAAITDPVKFAFAVAKLETQLKVTPRKAAPVPEKTVRGSAPVSGAADKTLERLEAEAERTGDRSKVIAYRRQLKRKDS